MTNDIYAHFLFDMGLIQDTVMFEDRAVSMGGVKVSADLKTILMN
jgi:hypothetical protein